MTDSYIEIETDGPVSKVTLDGKPIDDRLTGLKFHHAAGSHPLILLEYYAIPSKIRANLKFADVEIKASDKFLEDMHKEIHYLLGFMYEHLKDNIASTKQQYIDFNCKFCEGDS